jgi:hypothetical protein
MIEASAHDVFIFIPYPSFKVDLSLNPLLNLRGSPNPLTLHSTRAGLADPRTLCQPVPLPVETRTLGASVAAATRADPS